MPHRMNPDERKRHVATLKQDLIPLYVSLNGSKTLVGDALLDTFYANHEVCFTSSGIAIPAEAIQRIEAMEQIMQIKVYDGDTTVYYTTVENFVNFALPQPGNTLWLPFTRWDLRASDDY